MNKVWLLLAVLAGCSQPSVEMKPEVEITYNTRGSIMLSNFDHTAYVERADSITFPTKADDIKVVNETGHILLIDVLGKETVDFAEFQLPINASRTYVRSEGVWREKETLPP